MHFLAYRKLTHRGCTGWKATLYFVCVWEIPWTFKERPTQHYQQQRQINHSGCGEEEPHEKRFGRRKTESLLVVSGRVRVSGADFFRGLSLGTERKSGASVDSGVEGALDGPLRPQAGRGVSLMEIAGRKVPSFLLVASWVARSYSLTSSIVMSLREHRKRLSAEQYVQEDCIKPFKVFNENILYFFLFYFSVTHVILTRRDDVCLSSWLLNRVDMDNKESFVKQWIDSNLRGRFCKCKRSMPNLPIHSSTQAKACLWPSNSTSRTTYRDTEKYRYMVTLILARRTCSRLIFGAPGTTLS